MSDFLSNLASRSLDLMPVVQPRLSSRFEPLPFNGGFSSAASFEMQAAETERSVEGQLPPAQTPARTPDERVIESRQTLLVSPQLPDILRAERASVAGQSTRQPSPNVPPRQPSAHAPVLPVKTEAQRIHGQPTPTAPHAGLDQPPVSSTDSPPTSESSTSSSFKNEAGSALENLMDRVMAGQFSAVEGRAATRVSPPSGSPTAFQPEQREMPEQTPTIRVTIGRIDVRAIIEPSSPASHRTPARPAPQLSLADYLKQRSGGRR